MCTSLGPSKDDMMTALAKSVSIFARSRNGSVEARRASERLATLLKELRGASETSFELADPRPDVINNETQVGFNLVPDMMLSKPMPSTTNGQTSLQPSRDIDTLHGLTTEMVSLFNTLYFCHNQGLGDVANRV